MSSTCCSCAAPPVAPESAATAPAGVANAANPTSAARSPAWTRLAIAVAVAAQSMIFALAVNLSPPTGVTRLVLHAALAASALAVFLLVGPPLLRAALQRRIVFEQLFLAGIFGAFAASLTSSLTGVGHIYYEVVAILLAIYTLGRALGDRRRATALAAARALDAEFTTCERIAADGTIAPARVLDVRRGDRVHVAAGGGIPIDGLVEAGTALVDEATLTGEPFPVPRRPGDPVLAGSRLLDGPLRVRASADGDARQLDAMLARVRLAQSRASRLERQADRFVSGFLPAVFAVALLTFAGWTAHAGWTTGLFHALAVLLVACPCSMGLATPLGVWSALADLARHGLIAHSSDLVERLAQIDRVVFDKTGTLGDDDLEISDLVTAPGIDRPTLLAEIAALEAASQHPIARAFRRHATGAIASEFRILPGRGLAGRVNAAHLTITNAAPDPSNSPNLATLRAQLRAPAAATHELFIFRDGTLVGLVLLCERLRDSAREVIASLEASGLLCLVLTGDRATANPHALAALETSLAPLAKADRVRALSTRHRVLFVGDGANDAPAMASAHASLAMARGATLARDTAHGEIHDLRAIPAAITRCRAAVRTIRQNLAFAAAYNLIGITLAAAGLLHPIAAALLMLASSFTVSWRALRSPRARAAAV